MRYSSQCDDGNNVDGDGCSKDCRVEVGYSCYGGSPNSADTCSSAMPTAIAFEERGQSHLYGKIVLNVRLNYLPMALINSAIDCKNNCNNVLDVDIVSGYQGAKSISARYIPTTSFVFSIEIDFGREPIGMFGVTIGINQALKTQYFNGIDSSSTINIDVTPAYLAKVQNTISGQKDDILA